MRRLALALAVTVCTPALAGDTLTLDGTIVAGAEAVTLVTKQGPYTIQDYPQEQLLRELDGTKVRLHAEESHGRLRKVELLGTFPDGHDFARPFRTWLNVGLHQGRLAFFNGARFLAQLEAAPEQKRLLLEMCGDTPYGPLDRALFVEKDQSSALLLKMPPLRRLEGTLVASTAGPMFLVDRFGGTFRLDGRSGLLGQLRALVHAQESPRTYPIQVTGLFQESRSGESPVLRVAQAGPLNGSLLAETVQGSVFRDESVEEVMIKRPSDSLAHIQESLSDPAAIRKLDGLPTGSEVTVVGSWHQVGEVRRFAAQEVRVRVVATPQQGTYMGAAGRMAGN